MDTWAHKYIGKKIEGDCLDFIIHVMHEEFGVEIQNPPTHGASRGKEKEIAEKILSTLSRNAGTAGDGDVVFFRSFSGALHGGILVHKEDKKFVIHMSREFAPRLDSIHWFSSRFPKRYFLRRSDHDKIVDIGGEGVEVLVVAAVVTALVVGAILLYKWALSLLPEYDHQQERNDSYSLYGGRNKVRPFESIPLTIGKFRISPDYVVPPFNLYEPDDDDDKKAKDLYYATLCAGHGDELSLTELRDGDAPLDSDFVLENVSGMALGSDLVGEDENPKVLTQVQTYTTSEIDYPADDLTKNKPTFTGVDTVQLDVVFTDIRARLFHRTTSDGDWVELTLENSSFLHVGGGRVVVSRYEGTTYSGMISATGQTRLVVYTGLRGAQGIIGYGSQDVPQPIYGYPNDKRSARLTFTVNDNNSEKSNRLFWLEGFNINNSVTYDNEASGVPATIDKRQITRRLPASYEGGLLINIAGSLTAQNAEADDGLEQAFMFIKAEALYDDDGTDTWYNLANAYYSAAAADKPYSYISSTSLNIYGESGPFIRVRWESTDQIRVTLNFPTLPEHQFTQIRIHAYIVTERNRIRAQSDTKTGNSKVNGQFRVGVEGIGFERDVEANYDTINVFSLEGESSAKLNGRIDEITALATNPPTHTLTLTDIADAKATLISNNKLSNPAYWYYETLRGHKNSTGTLVWGAGVEDVDIDLPSIVQWAEFCYDNGLEVNAFLTSDLTVANMLDLFLQVGRGIRTFAQGKIGVSIDEFNKEVVADLDEGDVVLNSLKLSYPAETPYARFEAEFFDEDNDYYVDTIEKNTSEGGELGRVRGIRLEGITNATKAEKQLDLITAYSLHRRAAVVFNVSLRWWLLSKGDCVSLTHRLLRRTLTTRVAGQDEEKKTIQKRYLKILGTRFISNVEMEIEAVFDEHDYGGVYSGVRNADTANAYGLSSNRLWTDDDFVE